MTNNMGMTSTILYIHLLEYYTISANDFSLQNAYNNLGKC